MRHLLHVHQEKRNGDNFCGTPQEINHVTRKTRGKRFSTMKIHEGEFQLLHMNT